MNFQRGNDPLDSMELGRKKDAIPIVSVNIYTNGQKAVMDDPYVIEKFLERFSKFEIPNDPVFGPQRITFGCNEKYMDYSSTIVSALGRSLMPHYPDGEERERIAERSIFECGGKTAIINDKMFQIPSLKDLKENGFEHLQIIEENNQEKLKEKERIDCELMNAQLVHAKAMAQAHWGLVSDPLSSVSSEIQSIKNRIAGLDIDPGFEDIKKDIQKEIEKAEKKEEKEKTLNI
jgi:hypothetical protein